MTLKDFLKRTGRKQIWVSKLTKIHFSRLSMFLNGWIELYPDQVQRLSSLFGLTSKEVVSHEVKRARYEELFTYPEEKGVEDVKKLIAKQEAQEAALRG